MMRRPLHRRLHPPLPDGRPGLCPARRPVLRTTCGAGRSCRPLSGLRPPSDHACVGDDTRGGDPPGVRVPPPHLDGSDPIVHRRTAQSRDRPYRLSRLVSSAEESQDRPPGDCSREGEAAYIVDGPVGCAFRRDVDVSPGNHPHPGTGPTAGSLPVRVVVLRANARPVSAPRRRERRSCLPR